MRILIVYDTKKGSTEKVATFMSNVLSKISDVEISKPSEKNIQFYDAVVILSPIYYEKPLNSIISFIHANREALSSVPVCLGAVCMAQMFGHTAKSYAYKHYLAKMEKALGREPECQGIITGFLFKQGSRTFQDATNLAKRFCKILKMDNVK